MNSRSKSFFEDTLILFLVGGIIYAVYYFFFSSPPQTQVIENNTIIEKKVEKYTQPKEPFIESLVKAKALIENIDNQNKTEKKVETEKENITPNNITITDTSVATNIIENEEKEITVPIISKSKYNSVNSFYQYIEQQINTNISKNVNKYQLNSSKPVNIRITILKNGKSEQLTYMGGNRQYFDLIKPSVLEVFPVQIDDSIKDKFPRYFRMQVVY